jgi:hypothetical protein
MSKIPSPSWLTVPLEPSANTFMFVWLLPAFMGMTSPNFVLPVHLEAACITSALVTSLFCGAKYFLIVSKPSKDPSAQTSRSASEARQNIGFLKFAFRHLILFLWQGLFFGAGFWLASHLFGGSIRPFWECLLSATLVSIVVAMVILLQSLALDSHYKRERQTTT